MRRTVRYFSLLVVAASVAGCAASSVTTASSGVTHGSSAGQVAASAAGTPSGSASSSGGDTAQVGPLGVLAVPAGATPWRENTHAPIGLDAFVSQFYISSDQADEKRLYVRRGFASGIVEGWINTDGTQQSIAIARFSSVTGATSAFDDLANALREKHAPWKIFADPADGGVGAADPKLDSMGNAFVDVAARVGDYLVDVHEFSAASPDPAAARALLAHQVKSLKSKA